MRQIKFRWWVIKVGKMADWETFKKECDRLSALSIEGFIPMQFTGLLDKAGKEIYEGDIIQYKKPYRTTQTHEGDNIPNGSYTEPMEPGIKIGGGEIGFVDGCFSVLNDDCKDGFDTYPLHYAIREWDLPSIEEAISWSRPGAFIFDDPEEGDLQYLLELAKVKEPKELIEIFNGVEVIGNKYENPELI